MTNSKQYTTACPLARSAELTVERLSSETIVYDHQRHRVHCLNGTLAFVFEQCNGHTSVRQIAERLPNALNLPSNPDIVLIALRHLKEADLVTEESVGLTLDEHSSRRELMRRVATAGGTAAALIPAITTIVAPTPAMAQSRDSYTGPGNGNGNGNGNGVGEQNSNGHGHNNQ